MQTVCGSGASSVPHTSEAVGQALSGACRWLGDRQPALGLVFASPQHPLDQVLAAAEGCLPGVEFAAASSAGELTEAGLTHGGISAFLIAWGERSDHRLCVLPKMQTETLVEQLGDTAQRAHTFVVLGDGLDPALEALVVGLRKLFPGIQLLGAGAGDDGKLLHTAVGTGTQVLEGGALLIGVSSALRWSVGVDHGLTPDSPRMTITSATKNLVRSIDGTRALDVYEKRAHALGVTLSPETMPSFLVENELGILLFDDVVRVRAPIRVEQDGALTFAGEVPEGSQVCFMRGATDELVAAARSAAARAHEGLKGRPAAGVLVFSCICRGQLLGEGYEREIAAIRGVFPDAPIAGFLSYGEIAGTDQKLDGYHNNTVVVAALPA